MFGASNYIDLSSKLRDTPAKTFGTSTDRRLYLSICLGALLLFWVTQLLREIAWFLSSSSLRTLFLLPFYLIPLFLVFSFPCLFIFSSRRFRISFRASNIATLINLPFLLSSDSSIRSETCCSRNAKSYYDYYLFSDFHRLIFRLVWKSQSSSNFNA